MARALGSLWTEPRPPDPPTRGRGDWALAAILLAWSVAEAALRDDLASPPLVLAVVLVVLAPLMWRRRHPLGAVAVSFGTLIAVDVTRIIVGEETGLLVSIAATVVLPYALFRWGAGWEALTGLGIILVWLVISRIADPMGPTETVGTFAYFLFAAALGAAIRFHAKTRIRQIDQAKARERHQLARELHDTVAHHVSGIAIQAQAGRAIAAAQPERATEVLAVIEDAASRTLSELRTMVGVLRAAEADFAPRPGVADLERFAADPGGGLRIEVEMSGELDDLSPALDGALYRLAQESVTNARRHARSASRVTVRIDAQPERVHLTVDDDGLPSAGVANASGYGLVGMRERVTLLGGTFHAGPTAGGGWRVEALLPRTGTRR